MTTTLNSTQLFAPTIEQLNSDLQIALEKVRRRRNFDTKDWIDEKTDMLNDYMVCFYSYTIYWMIVKLNYHVEKMQIEGSCCQC